MTAPLSIPLERFETLRPEDVQLYLRSRGWEQDRSAMTDKALVYSYPNLTDAEVLVPRHRALADYALRMADVAEMLAAVEQRSAGEIVAELSLPPSDVLRLAIAAPNAGLESVPLHEGIRLIQGGRDLLLAAACSVHHPQPYYPRQSFKEATDFIDSCRLGQTERGSFVATIAAPVPPAVSRQRALGGLLAPEIFDVASEPFSRQVTIRLMTALGHVSESLETGSPDRILEGVSVGVSANLCAAIVAMKPSGEQSSLRLQMAWSRNRGKLPRHVPEMLSFSQGTFSIIDEVGRGLREQSTPKLDRIEGYVTQLRSDSPLLDGFQGTVYVKAELSGQPIRVRMTLTNKEDYIAACRAHAEGEKVAASGLLHREPKTFELRNPSNFQVLSRLAGQPAANGPKRAVRFDE